MLKLGSLLANGSPVKLSSSEVYDKSTKQTMAAFIAATNTSISGLEAAIAGKAPVTVVPDIAARDAQQDVITGMLSWVKDASADSTVTSGAAAYLAEVDGSTTTWTKVAEAESMDVVLQWANIQGKPSSAVADIDDAVSKKHEHANASVLNGLSEAATGNLVFNGKELNGETGIAVGASAAAATDYTAKLQIIVEEFDEAAA